MAYRDLTEEYEGRLGDQLVTAQDVANLMRVSPRTVLMLPIAQVRVGPRTIRYRLRDVYDYLAIEHPNA